MPEQAQTATQAIRIFDGSFCDSISYSVKAKNTDLEFDKFFRESGLTAEQIKDIEGYRATSYSGNKNPESDFHLHISSRLREGILNLEVDFVAGGVKPKSDEKEPFAEDFIAWLGQFLLNKELPVRIGADFTYAEGIRQSKFPLPLKTSVGQNSEIKIDGISFSIEGRPEGIEKVWITQTKKNLVVHIMADKVLDLGSINPRVDVARFGRALDAIIEEKNQ